jgi:hypothetical protein
VIIYAAIGFVTQNYTRFRKMYQEFVQKIKNKILEEIGNIHTTIPGKINAYNAEKCTADVTPYATYTLPNGQKMPYPKCCNVPVYFPQACSGKFSIVYPIKEGDECLLIFCERTLDIWRGVGEENTSETQFDLTNAVAIVGFFAKYNPNSVAANSEEKMIISSEKCTIELNDTTGEIKLKADKIDINGTIF